jgi:hypothetical protein
MNSLFKEIRHNPWLWLLVFILAVFASQKLKPEARILLFVLSVLAIVPLATLLVAGCSSVSAPGYANFASLTIHKHSADGIITMTSHVFRQDGRAVENAPMV